MEKRILLASVLSLFILLGYNFLVTRYAPPKPPQAQTLPAQEMSNLPAQITPQEIAQPAADAEPISLETKELDTKKLRLIFSNLGGKIQEVWFKDYNTRFFARPILGLWASDNLPFQFTQSSPGEIVLTFQDATRKIIKKFQVVNDYLLKVEIIAQDLTGSKTPLVSELNCFDLNNTGMDKDPQMQKEKAYAEFSISLPDKILRTNIAKVNEKFSASQLGVVNWLGLRDRYFCALFKPDSSASGYFVRQNQNKNADLGISLPSATNTVQGLLYLGPQDAQLLSQANAGWEQMVHFGTFDSISRLMLKVLGYFHNFLPNWGLSILALSVLIFFVLYPLTLKSMKSMRGMQKLQPQMEALKKQYQNDPQRLNKEIMELYRVNKINPFGGCLPLLLQIPIFFALYQALLRSAALKGSSFLWIKDLSEPDRLAILPASIPFLGNELNLLPILMAITMFFQQKISMKTTPGDPQQQKMMLILFPILFGFMFYHFPSGLALYWVVYSLLSLFFQWKQLVATKA
jgi:YidC/Oxa1 family membrane protein insertase